LGRAGTGTRAGARRCSASCEFGLDADEQRQHRVRAPTLSANEQLPLLPASPPQRATCCQKDERQRPCDPEIRAGERQRPGGRRRGQFDLPFLGRGRGERLCNRRLGRMSGEHRAATAERRRRRHRNGEPKNQDQCQSLHSSPHIVSGSSPLSTIITIVGMTQTATGRKARNECSIGGRSGAYRWATPRSVLLRIRNTSPISRSSSGLPTFRFRWA
jgi:hypothetical protein